MANQKFDYVEDEEALYYVHSPSSVSHTYSSECRNPESAIILSPYQSERSLPTRPTSLNHSIARFILSRYSSRSSTNTIHHQKRISYDLQSHETTTIGTENGENENENEDRTLLRICGVENHTKSVENKVEDDDEDEETDYETNGFLRFFSFGSSPSCSWILLQMSWRFLVSFGAALLVFFLATNPPPPTMSVKVVGIPQFGLGEGVDRSGVTTKILTCNCSLDLHVENKSKLFGLHIRPSTIQMGFGPVIFATSPSPKLYAENHESSTFNLSVGTKNKAMYGAGRNMQDMLESGKGVPLRIKLKLRSSFKVVGNLIKPKFNHNVECLLVLHGTKIAYSPNHVFSSNCRVASS
ncbi:hypothetical protein ACHQM5_018977 [Ranunculus cassubicifolius]